MRRVRHSDLSPRVEMTPMIDVTFLLLTFFIYSMVMMVRAEVLPVQLTTLSSGQKAVPGQIAAITLDATGKVFLNRQPVSEAELDAKLREFAAQQPQPQVFLAVEAQGTVDRGPLFINLLERVRRAGVTNFAVVGQPR